MYLQLYDNTTGLFYLEFALAIVYHAMLSCHGPIGVQAGCVEGHLLHFSNAANRVGLTRPGGLVFVLPVTEELLEQDGLGSRGKHLELRVETRKV